jgi:antitoxin (DNA-binding transcriptional repressor) of toxin-antitoxin stability system
MRVLTETEAQKAFDSLLDRVAAGEEFQITRRGRVVARLIAWSPEPHQESLTPVAK